MAKKKKEKSFSSFVNNQIDFLAATPVMNHNNGNVTFNLHHTLT